MRVNRTPGGGFYTRRFRVPDADLVSTPRTYSTGLASVVHGAALVTITTGVVASWMAGSYFNIQGSAVIYTIQSVDKEANTLTLTGNFAASTATNAAYLVTEAAGTTLMPSVGDTHSVDTSQIVNSIQTEPVKGATTGYLVVTYFEPRAVASI